MDLSAGPLDTRSLACFQQNQEQLADGSLTSRKCGCLPTAPHPTLSLMLPISSDLILQTPGSPEQKLDLTSLFGRFFFSASPTRGYSPHCSLGASLPVVMAE